MSKVTMEESGGGVVATQLPLQATNFQTLGLLQDFTLFDYAEM